MLESNNGHYLLECERYAGRRRTEDFNDKIRYTLSESSHSFDAMRRDVEERRSVARHTRRSLAIWLLAIGGVLLIANPILIPLTASAIAGMSSTKTANAAKELESRLSAFEERTKLGANSDKIVRARIWMEAVETSLASIVADMREISQSFESIAGSQAAEAPASSGSLLAELATIREGWASVANVTPAVATADTAGDASESTGPDAPDGSPPQVSTTNLNARFSAFLASAVSTEQTPFLVLYPDPALATTQELRNKIKEYHLATKAPPQKPPADGDTPQNILDSIVAGNTRSVLDNVVDATAYYRISLPSRIVVIDGDDNELIERISSDASVIERTEKRIDELATGLRLLATTLEGLSVPTGLTMTVPSAAEGTESTSAASQVAFKDAITAARTELDALASIGANIQELQEGIRDGLERLNESVGIEKSIGPLTQPYAYVVLALAAMFLTIGLQIFIRWARAADEDLDEAKHLWNNATITGLIGTLHAAGIDADDFSKIATSLRSTDAKTVSTGLLPSPLMKTAEDGFEIIRSVK